MSNDAETGNTAAAFPTYIATNTHPGELPGGLAPSVSIYFDGLLCLCFNHKEGCTVGVNVQGGHNLMLQIWKKPACEGMVVALPNPVRTIDLIVKKGATPVNDVQVYNGAPIKVGRTSENRDKYDYCLDLENPRMHGKLDNNSGTLWPRFNINRGIFCAFQVSETVFELQNALHGTKPLGKIALSLAADIFFSTGESIDVLADGKPLSPAVTLAHPNEYEIAITNTCATNPYRNPKDPDPAKRNDFHHYYKVLSLGSSEHFGLWPLDPLGTDTRLSLGPCSAHGHPFSDRAPCMPVGFGQTTDFH